MQLVKRRHSFIKVDCWSRVANTSSSMYKTQTRKVSSRILRSSGQRGQWQRRRDIKCLLPATRCLSGLVGRCWQSCDEFHWLPWSWCRACSTSVLPTSLRDFFVCLYKSPQLNRDVTMSSGQKIVLEKNHVTVYCEYIELITLLHTTTMISEEIPGFHPSSELPPVSREVSQVWKC